MLSFHAACCFRLIERWEVSGDDDAEIAYSGHMLMYKLVRCMCVCARGMHMQARLMSDVVLLMLYHVDVAPPRVASRHQPSRQLVWYVPSEQRARRRISGK